MSGYSEKKHLRRAGKRKYCRGDNATIKPENRIGDRPEIVEKRERFGDWEVDTVLGVVGRGGLVSAVDRRSRFYEKVKHLTDCIFTLIIGMLLPNRYRLSATLLEKKRNAWP